MVAASSQAPAQQQKPNIIFIMGDDIGWMEPSIYLGGRSLEAALFVLG